VSGTVDTFAWIGRRIGKPPGWERIVRLFAAPEKCGNLPEVCITRDGTRFVAQPGVVVGWHVAFFGTYEPEVRKIFRAVLPANGAAVDIGANVGWHTLLMASLVGDGGRVLAVEPNPSVRARLQENLSLNGFSHVEVSPYAIMDSDGVVTFHSPEAADMASGAGHVITAAAEGDPGAARIEARRLDSLVPSMGLERLDLIKIDIEGFEWPALKGAEQTIARFRPHIVFEYLAECADRGGGTPAVLEQFFRRHGYRLYAIGRSRPKALAEGRWPPAANLWAVPSPEADTLIHPETDIPIHR